MYTISFPNMDPSFSDQGFDNTHSRNPRSRAGSGVSTTEGLLQNLQLAESTSFETDSYTTSRPTSSRSLASPAYLSPSLSHSPGFLPTPLSQHQHAFPSLPSEAALSDAEWFEAQQQRAQGAPLLRLEPASDQLGAPSSSPPLASIETEAMSAVAVSYDPTFNMGTRSSFTWPVMESGNNLMPPDLGPYGSDASLTPPSGSRSVTSSPPRTLTAEQRELKRQRDQARHSSKLHARGRRADSSSSSVYSPPVTLADMTTGASSMPVYTTAPSQISLLAEPTAPQYLPPFSPPLPDPNQASMFSGAYSTQPYIPDYGYPPTTTPSLPSHYGYVSAAEDEQILQELALTTEQQAPCARPEHGHVPSTASDSSGTGGRERASQGGAQPAEAAVLGTRVQRPAVLDFQQPAPAPTREVGPGGQGDMSELRRRVHEDDGAERPLITRQVQEEELQLGEELMGGVEKRAIHHNTHPHDFDYHALPALFDLLCQPQRRRFLRCSILLTPSSSSPPLYKL